MQLLYHWNFGPPYLGEGSEFAAPIEALAPRDARAAGGLDRWTNLRPAPSPASPSRSISPASVERARTAGPWPCSRPGGARRRSSSGSRTGQLPCFTLWKNTRGLAEGYVTGLEPATNYPNPRPFEEARGRVVPLPTGGTYLAETTLEVLDRAEEIRAVEAEIAAIQARGRPTIHPRPAEPFTIDG